MSSTAASLGGIDAIDTEGDVLAVNEIVSPGSSPRWRSARARRYGRRMRGRAGLAGVVVALAAAGCGGGGPPAPTHPRAPRPTRAARPFALDRGRGHASVLNLEVHNVGLAGGLARREVRALLRYGWELAAHTLTHADLTTVGAARLRHEVAGSRRWLRRAFGVPVDVFAYPAGRYDARAEAAARAAGFRGATTTDAGVARRGGDPYALPRLRVTPQLTAPALLALVRATSARPS